MAADDQNDQPDIQFEVELCEGEDWGIKLTHDLQILGIRNGGPFDLKCVVGDQIVQVNDSPVKTIEEFESVTRQSGPLFYIQVLRGLKATELRLLPPEREKNVRRRDGYSYHLAQIDYQTGCKFGLGIKHYQSKVLVSRVDDGSLSAKSLVLGDRIVDVNGAPVTDKNVARDMLMRSLQQIRTVSLLIERAETQEAKDTVTSARTASEMQPPSVAFNSDVQDIIRRQKQKMKQKNLTSPKKAGIIRRGKSSEHGRRVSVVGGRKEVVIASDNEGKALKRVGPK